MAHVNTSGSGMKGVYTRVYIPRKLRALPTTLKKNVNIKQVCYDCATMFVNSANRFVPKDTGALREKGYKIHISNSKDKPWYKVQYRNTAKLPYVMYQYYGKVWGPNYAKFTGTVSDKITKKKGKWVLQKREADIKWDHVGWVSSKNRHETSRKFRRRKKTIYIAKNKKIIINGYKYRGSHPKWVEWAETHSKGFYDYISGNCWYVESVYQAAITGKKIPYLNK